MRGVPQHVVRRGASSGTPRRWAVRAVALCAAGLLLAGCVSTTAGTGGGSTASARGTVGSTDPPPVASTPGSQAAPQPAERMPGEAGDATPSGTASSLAGAATTALSSSTPADGATTAGSVTATSSLLRSSTARSAPPEPPAPSAFTGLQPALSATYGPAVPLTFALVSGGAALPGGRTLVSFAGRSVPVVLDGDGRGAAALDGLPVGATTVTIRYLGDAAHQPSTATVTVSVSARPTEVRNVTRSAATVAPGQKVTIGFDVLSAGSPAAGSKATVTHAGTTTSVPLDGKGHGSLTISGLPEGQNKIVVKYSGDPATETPSTPVSITVTVAAPKPAPKPGSGQCPASARACIDLTNNKSWLQSGGTIVYGPVPITSGRPGHRTPAGTFQVYWKDKDHKSSLFDNAPMPNSVFFVGGIAFHQGSLSVPSHGCIHLSWAASAKYFNTLRNGDLVYVFGYAKY